MAEIAIDRNLQIMCEAVNHLAEEITAAHPGVPWPQIRDSWFTSTSVDVEVVRDVVETPISCSSRQR